MRSKVKECPQTLIYQCYFGEWSHGKKHGTGSTGKPFFDLNQVLSAKDLDASFVDQFQPESLVEFVNDQLVFTTQWLFHEQDDVAVLERTKKVVLEAIMAGRQAFQVAEKLIAEEKLEALLAESKQIREDLVETREFRDSSRLDKLFKSTVFLQRWWRRTRSRRKLPVKPGGGREDEGFLDLNRSDSDSDQSMKQEEQTEVEKLVALFQGSEEQDVAWPSVVSPAMRMVLKTTSSSYQKMIEECGIVDPTPSLSLLVCSRVCLVDKDELLDEVCLEMMQSPRDKKLNPLHVYCMNPSITLKASEQDLKMAEGERKGEKDKEDDETSRQREDERVVGGKYEASSRDVGGKSAFQEGGRGDVDGVIAFHEQGMILICSHPSAHVMVTTKNKSRWNRIPLHDLCGNNCASNKIIGVLWEDDQNLSVFHILCQTQARKINSDDDKQDSMRDLEQLLNKLVRSPDDLMRFGAVAARDHSVFTQEASTFSTCFIAPYFCRRVTLRSAKLSSFEGDLPVHLLASNVSATRQMFQILLEAFPESVMSLNRKGQTILHQVCSNSICTHIDVLDLVYRKTLPCPLLSVLEQAETMKDFVDKQQKETEIRKVAANRRKSSIANLRRSSGASTSPSPGAAGPAQETLDEAALEKMLLAVKKKLHRSAAKEDLHQVLSSYFQHAFQQEGSEYTSTWKMLHIELNLELERLSVDKAAVVDLLVDAYPEALNVEAQELSAEVLPLSYFVVSSREVPDVKGQWSQDDTADSRQRQTDETSSARRCS
ncbi:hypothetical protein GUITHDRAFT_147119 [Guillardia theta CCMP2712]|uniref:Uncharacterized protein n=1 Tax=Guillardia theta (strain CCMP2712) TaxID=905079 RepID=L1IFB1_GUITC|nr:hypothetical protein GUITHDRAFT_147119 [Guillardia theta CCMP2712]EKX34599.1 hypothetical protein GUITHDRAFT_147119 [Guillardia theta CCMP2712]|eukprot:XP_005821579.1 hypothetical protein GUITHDRAFT_147119 [Guillardia theta CCMP2712]